MKKYVYFVSVEIVTFTGDKYTTTSLIKTEEKITSGDDLETIKTTIKKSDIIENDIGSHSVDYINITNLNFLHEVEYE